MKGTRRSGRTTLHVLLLAVTCLAFLARVPSIAEPLGIDQGLWASAVRGLARGQSLYADVFEQRPPGIFLAYLAAFSVFGWQASSIAWLDIAASVATAWVLFALVRRLGGTTMGATAAALYATLTMPAWLYGHGGFLERSVSETFIVLSVSIAALCAARLIERGELRFAIGLGLACGTAVMFKPNAGAYFPAMLLWAALYGTWRGRSLARMLTAATLASAAVPVAGLIWLWSDGVVADAKVALIDFNRFYLSEGLAIQTYALEFSKAVWLRMKTQPLWAAGGIGALVVAVDLARRRRLDPLPGLAVIWGAAAAAVIVVNGARLYNSYFMQALGALVVLAAWLLAVGRSRPVHHRVAAVLAGVVMVTLLVGRGYPARLFGHAWANLSELRGVGDHSAYLERFGGYATGRGYSARANDELATYVRARTGRDDFIYQFGINGAGVYFETDRLTAQRFLRVNVFVASDFPDPTFQLPYVLGELKSRRPVYLIFERLHSRSAMGRQVDALQQHPDVVRLLEPYTWEAQIEDFTLYRLAN